MPRPKRLFVLAMFVVSVFLAMGQSTPPKPPSSLQGTVNIILANRHGLIAVTDSLLSNDDATVKAAGQKLFQLDDSTILTIAGWYSDPGPSIDNHSIPANTTVPEMMSLYRLQKSAGKRIISIEDKMKLIHDDFKFLLEVVAEIDKYKGRSGSKQPSELTIAGYDKDTLKILRVDLTPDFDTDPITYQESDYPTLVVQDKLQWVVRGIRDVAQPILEHPERYDFKSDPILQHYSEAMSSDGGRALSLDDMAQIAKRLERLTADRWRGRVGGLREVARLKDGAIDQPIEQPPAYTNLGEAIPILKRIDHPETSHSDSGLIVKDIMGALVTDGNFAFIGNQPLDNIFFFRTTFDNCSLTYSGGPFIFDASNTVKNSKLFLMGNAKADSADLVQFKSDFPGVPVVDETKK